LTVAHYFTLLRIFLIPLFVLIYLHADWFDLSPTLVPLLLMLVLGLSELSDAFDGFLARRLNQVTDLGKILDPMADSLSRLAVFFSFTQGIVQIPLEWAFLMLYRDSTVSTLRTVCALKGFALSARRSGKFKAFIQASVAFLILGMLFLHAQNQIALETLRFWSSMLAGAAALLTVLSGVDYVFANRSFVKKLLER
jgi:CDP-diacylglycerol--glycerol-3-phosphate 3-phosphatidyltransferase